MKKIKSIILTVCLAIITLTITGCGCEKEKYTVTFDSNGGSEVASQTVEKGGKASVPIAPTKDGYIFSKWLLYGVEYDFDDKVEEDITLVASWIEDGRLTYTITFDSNGGSKVDSLTIREGDVPTSPQNPVRENYIFIGWYLDNEEYDFTDKVTKNITLVAKWEEVEEDENIVTFNTNGGSKIKNQKVVTGEKATKPTNPTKEGYNFVKWQLDGIDYNFNTSVTKDITLVAVWAKKKQYTVAFDTDGGSVVNKVMVYENSKVEKPTNPTKEGYNFVKWQLDGKDYDFNSKVTKNITLKAIWEKKEETKPEEIKYTVTFNTDGGSTIDNVVVSENNKVVKPTNPTKEGYNFVKWQLDGKDYDFSSKVTKNITLKAIWEKIEVKYTVTFKNEGNIVQTIQVVEGNKLGTLPTNPTKDGYKFLGWYNGSQKYDENTQIVSEITLEAKWEEIVKVYTYTVSGVDSYTPSRYINLFVDGTKLTDASSIYYLNDVLLSKTIENDAFVVSKADLNELDANGTIKIKLVDGTIVQATKE